MERFFKWTGKSVRMVIFFYVIVSVISLFHCGQQRSLVRESDELSILGKKKSATPTRTEIPKTGENPSQKTPLPLMTTIVQPTLENLSKLSNYTLSCGNRTLNLDETIKEIATDLESQKLLYNSKPYTDCSGIFHRVLREIKKKCPDYDLPDAKQYRDTRDLARWYFERGELIIIEDPFTAADLIKPGAVLFFGHRDKKYKNIKLTELFAASGIEHMGVVVDVQHDNYQRVMSYGLFHGQTTGKIASTTRFHARKSSQSNLPPFGNWNQQWVAFARIVKPLPELITTRR